MNERNGEGGIRTPGTVTRPLVFETSAISHSATSPAACRPDGQPDKGPDRPPWQPAASSIARPRCVPGLGVARGGAKRCIHMPVGPGRDRPSIGHKALPGTSRRRTAERPRSRLSGRLRSSASQGNSTRSRPKGNATTPMTNSPAVFRGYPLRQATLNISPSSVLDTQEEADASGGFLEGWTENRGW